MSEGSFAGGDEHRGFGEDGTTGPVYKLAVGDEGAAGGGLHFWFRDYLFPPIS